MNSLLQNRRVEIRLLAVLALLCIGLSLSTDTFLTMGNITALLNNNSVNLIWAVGLLVVLIAGGIDISFAVASSVVQYLAAKFLIGIGGGNWALGFLICGLLGIALGLINAGLIYRFRIISIVVTIATFNAFFGLLMFISGGRSIYALPDWWSDRVILFEHEAADGTWSDLTLPFAVMVVCVALTWILIRRVNIGRQLYAFGDNPEGARRAGVSIAAMQALAFGWCGLMAGIAGLMQVNIVQEVVPNALYGRELEVLAAVVLGGARLGGGRGTITGCALGVMFVAVTQNGLNLLGVSPFAFQMIIGAAILVAISTSNISFAGIFGRQQGGTEMNAAMQRLRDLMGRESFGLVILMAIMVAGFSIASPQFLTPASLASIGFQAPLLGILTLAMLAPMISGGFNLAIIYTANISGLTFAWVLLHLGGAEAGIPAILLGALAALAVGTIAGAVMGAVIAYVGAHPILVSLAMMIFLRGLGEFLTRGGDISGFPPQLAFLGHGSLFGIPMPLVLFAIVAVIWHIMLRRSRHGFAVYMVGSNIRATEYSGIDTKRTLVLIYAFSGTLCAVAGILMAARFNSVRVGHGEALLLVTVLAIFLGGIDPFGGHGKVAPVVLSVLILQILTSGLNLIGANQHLSTAVWGLFLIAVMILRSEQTQSLLYFLSPGRRET